jgi:hypothetical protein
LTLAGSKQDMSELANRLESLTLRLDHMGMRAEQARQHYVQQHQVRRVAADAVQNVAYVEAFKKKMYPAVTITVNKSGGGNEKRGREFACRKVEPR